MITLQQALARATSQLSAHSDLSPTALPDAALLLMHTLGVSRATLIAHPERTLDRDQQAAYQRLLERRLRFEPIQYILGEAEFFGLTLRVTPAVLIPRPETELLVEAVIAHVTGVSPQTAVPGPSQLHREGWGIGQSPAARTIADVGTGSGAIAIALAHSLPQALVTALDLSPAALALARENAKTHRLEDRIRFLESDLLAAVANEPRFDIIASNPPYIPTGDSPTLHPQVRDHEPAQALFAGPTGLEIYERLIPQAHALLKPGALLALEIGYGQRDAIAALLANWNGVKFASDLQQIPRVALARRP